MRVTRIPLVYKTLVVIIEFVERMFLFFGFVLIRDMAWLSRKRELFYHAWDYVRYSSLDLCANEICERKVQGSVAEVGVYRGEFAVKINELFPDKKLYLFDTFKGFDERDITVDEKHGDKTKAHNIDFSDTSVESVLRAMPHPENCIVRSGYFPETATGINEKFAFVSIDTDLYQPIYDGLQYFYSRLSEGGYIFVHDYNHKMLPGVKKAVRQFSRENGVIYFPLTDHDGTVVFTKNGVLP